MRIYVHMRMVRLTRRGSTRVGLARSIGYGLRPPCPIRLVRRIPARTPMRTKPLGEEAAGGGGR